ncbi:MAG TPA: hypothetical protein VHV53_08145 [Solirubrobacterales bacterium]|jgi:hypothetical protein|nr:hypothetical protein [Solirubrobacterales bacterium]
MKKRYLLLPCLLLALALAVSACGGGSSSSGGGSDEEQIEETIETASTSTDPSSCTEFATQEYWEQLHQVEGAAAVKKCEEAAEGGEVEESAEVSEVEIEGSEASATVKLAGGAYGGQTLAVELVKEEGQWKLGGITGFAVLDKGLLAETLGSEFEEKAETVGSESEEESLAELGQCVVETFEESSQTEIEELLFTGPVLEEELIAECGESLELE